MSNASSWFAITVADRLSAKSPVVHSLFHAAASRRLMKRNMQMVDLVFGVLEKGDTPD